MIELITFIILLLVGIIVGGANERRHFKRLSEQEEQLAHIQIVNLKTISDQVQPGGILVSGNVVIAVDYFKRIMALLRLVFGGELRAYQTILIRARREAILRMKRQAAELGADKIYNVRLEFSSIGAQPSKIGGSELLAYGTAVKSL